MTTRPININDVLDGHVVLEVHCADRLLLNAYVPKLQVGGQVVTFLTDHLGCRVPSPALLEKIGNRFRHDVKTFAARGDIPVLNLKKPDRTRWDDRKLDHVRPYLDKAEAEGRSGVVAIVATQEFPPLRRRRVSTLGGCGGPGGDLEGGEKRRGAVSDVVVGLLLPRSRAAAAARRGAVESLHSVLVDARHDRLVRVSRPRAPLPVVPGPFSWAFRRCD